MDIKKMSLFIMTLGLILSLYGTAIVIRNKEIKHKSSSFSLKAMGNYLESVDKNLIRQERRDKAVKFCVIGGISLFLGIGLFLSSHKRNDDKQAGKIIVDQDQLKIQKESIVDLIKNKQFKQALNQIEILLSDISNYSDFDLYRLKGIILFKVGRKEQSKDMFLHALKLGDPQSKSILEKYFRS